MPPNRSTLLCFDQHPVGGLLSIAHLVPRSKGRTGIYVLGFAGGERYVGQALDVAQRFSAHRRRWRDIDTVEFCRVPAGQLNDIERRVIHEHQHRGVKLRNITHALGNPTATSDLDWQVERSEQLAWLTDSAWLEDTPERTGNQDQRAAKSARYQALAARPDFVQLGDVARTYVQLCVPRPRATELTFWALSAMPTTNRSTWPRLFAVSINKMETLVIGHHKGEPERYWGFLNLSRTALVERVGSLTAIADLYHCAFQERDYEAAGGDVLGLAIDEPSAIADGLKAPFSPLVAAARELDLRLMRKGPTFQWRGHCFDLADHVV